MTLPRIPGYDGALNYKKNNNDTSEKCFFMLKVKDNMNETPKITNHSKMTQQLQTSKLPYTWINASFT